LIVHHFTTPITTPFARKSTQIYGDLCRLWEKAKIKESAKKPEITGLCRLIKGYKIMIKVLFVCHGNICRSTMAESVMTYLVEKEGLADKFYINSAATSREEIGNGVHYGTVAKLKKEGIPVIPHRAVQMTLNDYEEYDYLIGMDTENIRNMQRISGGDPDEKIYKLLTFAGNGLDVADPWYTGDFEATYRDVLAGCKGLLECLKEEL
jgi:protein-tyrosine phosphatase